MHPAFNIDNIVKYTNIPNKKPKLRTDCRPDALCTRHSYPFGMSIMLVLNVV